MSSLERKIVNNLLLLIFSLLLTACASHADKKPQTTPLDKLELSAYQYCGSDSDCVYANNGCCDCANGGEAVAVNKERLKDFRARFDCMKTMCTRMAAVPACDSGVVSCIEHRCKYFPKK